MGEPLIYSKIIAVMREIEAIGKDRKNTQGSGYNFRGIDDVYNEIHEHLAKHGVFTVPKVLEDRSEERTSQKGSTLIYRILKMQYTFYAEDGSSFDAVTIGEAMDSGDKASNKAMSAAHKYAFIQVFAIPTNDPKDAENETHQVRSESSKPTTRDPPKGESADRQVILARWLKAVHAFAEIKISEKQMWDKLGIKTRADIVSAHLDQLEAWYTEIIRERETNA